MNKIKWIIAKWVIYHWYAGATYEELEDLCRWTSKKYREIAIDEISKEKLGVFLFGHGLGYCTNTANGQLSAAGRFDEIPVCAELSFFVIFSQFGILGSLLFWIGVLRLLILVNPRQGGELKTRYYVTMMFFIGAVLGDIMFEHYFLMMSFATAFGSIYWDKLNNNRLYKHEVIQ